MNNRYHERLWQISIHCYREVLCMCMCVFVRGNHSSIHFFCLIKCVCNYSMCQHAAYGGFACCIHVYSLTYSLLEYLNPHNPQTPTGSFITALSLLTQTGPPSLSPFAEASSLYECEGISKALLCAAKLNGEGGSGVIP